MKPMLPLLRENPGRTGSCTRIWDITDLPGGSYTLFLEFYFPPHYKPGDEKAYVNYLDNPLMLREGAQEIKNLNMLIPISRRSVWKKAEVMKKP